MWSNFVTANVMGAVLEGCCRTRLQAQMTLNVLSNTRRARLTLTRSKNTKIGFDCFSKRLQVVTQTLKMNWIDMKLEDFRIMFKNIYKQCVGGLMKIYVQLKS